MKNSTDSVLKNTLENFNNGNLVKVSNDNSCNKTLDIAESRSEHRAAERSKTSTLATCMDSVGWQQLSFSFYYTTQQARFTPLSNRGDEIEIVRQDIDFVDKN